MKNPQSINCQVKTNQPVAFARILALEVNELPWEIVDWAISTNKFPNVAEFFLHSKSFSTVLSHQGDLSPWSTWPTIHRGMKIIEHGVQSLGQDIRTYSGTALWDDLIDMGYSVGIFGALQSWPPRKPGYGGFYLPDTFSPNPDAYPSDLENFQRFNLSMVRSSGRKVTNRLGSDKIKLLLKSRIGVKGFSSIGKQLFLELAGWIEAEGRTTTQSLLTWNLFKRHYIGNQVNIAYASWFTNHIASVMHRHWDQLFPLQYDKLLKSQDPKKLRLFYYAFSLLDKILADAISFSRSDEKNVTILLSSMGQEPVKVSSKDEFALICRDLNKFACSFSYGNSLARPNLAMVPQISFSFEQNEFLQSFLTEIEDKRPFIVMEDGSSNPLIENIMTHGDSVSLTLASRLSMKPLYIQGSQSQKFNLNDFGISAQKVDSPSAYHSPNGIISFYGKRIDPSSSRDYFLPAENYKSVVSQLITSQSGLEDFKSQFGTV